MSDIEDHAINSKSNLIRDDGKLLRFDASVFHGSVGGSLNLTGSGRDIRGKNNFKSNPIRATLIRVSRSSGSISIHLPFSLATSGKVDREGVKGEITTATRQKDFSLASISGGWRKFVVVPNGNVDIFSKRRIYESIVGCDGGLRLDNAFKDGFETAVGMRAFINWSIIVGFEPRKLGRGEAGPSDYQHYNQQAMWAKRSGYRFHFESTMMKSTVVTDK